MARTYYNSGPAGRDYGKLMVSRFGRVVRFKTQGGDPVLNLKQVQDLVEHLQAWLDEHAEPEPPVMMEGEL